MKKGIGISFKVQQRISDRFANIGLRSDLKSTNRLLENKIKCLVTRTFFVSF